MNVSTTQYLNLDYLKLMAGDDPEMIQTMIEMLLDELPTEFESMKSLHGAEDWNSLSNVSHKMKSTLAFVGNAALTATNAKIETYSKTGENLSEIGGLLLLFEELLPPVMAELNSTLSGN